MKHYIQKQKVIFAAVCVFAAFFVGIAIVRSEDQSAKTKAVEYLKNVQQDAWTSMALAGANEQEIVLDHLSTAPQEQKSATTYAKYILALAANGKNPTNFGDEDYVEALKSYFDGAQFGGADLINDDIWAVIALSALGKEYLPQVQLSKAYILAQQNTDGGWGYNITADSDTNDTASAIIALLQAGVKIDSASISAGIDYLKSSQNSDGGFGYMAGLDSDACSTGWVVSMLYSLGQTVDSAGWLKDGKNPFDILFELQDDDGGFWWQAQGDNKFCSPYAALALLEKSYPVNSQYNLYNIVIEKGNTGAICQGDFYGATAMELLTNAAHSCGLHYSIDEYAGLGLYLAEMAGVSGWMYKVNDVLPEVGADNYYLEPGDEVLWYLFESAQEYESRSVGLAVEIKETTDSEGDGGDGGNGDDASGGDGGGQGIEFSVFPDLLDFGLLAPGGSSSMDLTVENGNMAVLLSAEVNGSSVFTDYLELDNILWRNFSAFLGAGEVKTLNTRLFAPINYSGDFGQKQGELIFWANVQ